jgi:hypothetical protein
MLSSDQPSYTCPRCGRTSYNPQDALQGYCGHCHTFEDQNALTEALERGSEPFWMQDVRLNLRRIAALREVARRQRNQGPPNDSASGSDVD